MIDTPQIVQTKAQLLAKIHVTVPRAEIMNVMGPGYQEVMTAVAAQGLAPAGPWLTHHLRMDPEVFDFEICVPVNTPVRPAGRVEPGEWPAGRVVRTIYRGPYESLGDAWGEFMAWIENAGYKPAPDVWEVYLKGPESSSDPALFETELSKPLV